MRSRIADQRWPDQKAVAIEFNRAPIVVVVKTSLDRVALADEILAKDVGDVNILMTSVEPVQAAICVLLEHREVRGVELHAIVVQRAKHARAEIVVGKDESAKIGNERLNSGAYRNEIVVGVDVSEFHFAKRLFE